MYKSFTYLVKFIPRHLILLDVIIKELFFIFFFSLFTVGFVFVFILCSATLLNSFISASSFLWNLPGFLCIVCHLQIVAT